jgi:predicted Zn-dependent protease
MPKNYLVTDWGRQLRLTTPETITINGMPAATAAGRTLIDGQLAALRLIVIRFTKDMMARFIVLDKSPLIAADSVELRRTTYSFRRLSPADKAIVQPRRITVETVSADADIGQLWRKMRVGDFPQQRFNVLNGVAVGRQINVGDLIKIVR